MKTKIILSFIFIFGAFIFLAFMAPQDQKKAGPWEIPAKYTKMENTYKGDVELEKLGKNLYAKHCRSCHGNVGAGDGPKAKNLDTNPGDFADSKFQAHTDGELYYMSIVGRDEMPNFEKSLVDEEARWAVVNYLRTFKK